MAGMGAVARAQYVAPPDQTYAPPQTYASPNQAYAPPNQAYGPLNGPYAPQNQPYEQASPQQYAQPLAPQQLDDLVAPVALYPDPLLGQVLVAATYPVELMEAEQWLQANSNLQGQPLIDAAQQQSWDASVQALVAMPDVLARLTQDIRWTTDLGNAFLAQQADVMSAVQRMRMRAQGRGYLRSSPQQTVTTQNQGGQAAVQIEPAIPQLMYVPVYNPYSVWGPPAGGFYPPLSYAGPGFGLGSVIDLALCFGRLANWGFGAWGWGLNWLAHTLFLNGPFFNHFGFHNGLGSGGGFEGRSVWIHDPVHRLGLAYPNRELSYRFGGASRAARMVEGRSGNWGRGGGNFGSRDSFRGTPSEAGVRSPQGFRNSRAFEGSSSFQRFQGRQSYSGSPQRYAFQSQGHSYQAQQFRAPQQRFESAQRFQSAPRMSARSFSGGGGGHVGSSLRSSGSGGRSHSFSGSGGHSHGGGFHFSGHGGGGHGGGGHHGGGHHGRK